MGRGTSDVLLMIKGAIAEQTPEDQVKIQAAIDELKAVIDKYGEHGTMALAYVGAEASQEE